MHFPSFIEDVCIPELCALMSPALVRHNVVADIHFIARTVTNVFRDSLYTDSVNRMRLRHCIVPVHCLFDVCVHTKRYVWNC
jgi:hypothetical protein